MNQPTKYHNLTVVELLREVDDVRHYSPIIEELCQRLENIGETCPVCEADLYKAFKELE